MKKWLSIVAVLLVCVLAACSSDDASAPAEKSENSGEAGKLGAGEVLERSIETAQNIESAELTMEITQQIDIPNQELSFSTVTSTEAQVVMDPLAMYQKGVVTIEADGESEEQEMEIYLDGNEMYMFEGMTGQWLKMDSTTIPVDQMQQDPVEQLELMQKFVDEMELEEADGQYVLKITGNGDELIEFTKEAMDEYMDEELMTQLEQDGIDPLESMSIQHVYYEIFIDQETYETKGLNLDMEMSIDAEGETLQLTQSMVSEYTGLNSIDSITVPEEVKNEAVDLVEQFENLEGLELEQ